MPEDLIHLYHPPSGRILRHRRSCRSAARSILGAYAQTIALNQAGVEHLTGQGVATADHSCLRVRERPKEKRERKKKVTKAVVKPAKPEVVNIPDECWYCRGVTGETLYYSPALQALAHVSCAEEWAEEYPDDDCGSSAVRELRAAKEEEEWR